MHFVPLEISSLARFSPDEIWLGIHTVIDANVLFQYSQTAVSPYSPDTSFEVLRSKLQKSVFVSSASDR